jgi:hypothetical protein
MPTPFRLVFALSALLSIRALMADEVRLDVVGDVTEAGKKFAHPTPDKPVYYYPDTVGYKEMGNYLIGEKPPPLTPEVENMIAKALYEQGYRLVTRQSPPALLLVFWWGYIAPQTIDASAASALASLQVTNSLGQTMTMGFSGRPGGPAAAAMAAQEAGDTGNNTNGEITGGGINAVPINQNQMLTLLAGDKYDRLPQGAMSFKSPPLRDEINRAALTPRYYVMVSAFDFQIALKQKKMVRLWTARMSTARAGTTLDKVLPALITAGGPIFGRDTALPMFVQERTDPMGRVILGAPVVKDYPNASAAAPAADK